MLKELPDNSIDLIVTDPPYLINYKSRRSIYKDYKYARPIDNDTKAGGGYLIERFFNQAARVLKDNSAAYVFCSPKTVSTFKTLGEKSGLKLKNEIVWRKNHWSAGDLYAQFGHSYELLLLFNRGRSLLQGKRISDVWEFPRVSGSAQVHQNQKPVDLLKRCIQYHSKPGDIVLDPFMGSGSTGVACAQMERDFIGMEIEQTYFEIAQRRISEARANAEGK